VKNWKKSVQLPYLVRLYLKELVLENFAGLPAEQLLERMIEFSSADVGRSGLAMGAMEISECAADNS
jgi:hypothetical protein